MVKVPQILRVNLVLDAAELGVELIGLRARGRRAEQVADFVVARQQRPGAGDALLDVAGDGLCGIELRLLRQVADADVARDGRGAHEVRIRSGQDAQQGGFTGAVAADDADLRAVEKRERDLVEHVDAVVLFGQTFKLEDIFAGHANTSWEEFRTPPPVFPPAGASAPAWRRADG